MDSKFQLIFKIVKGFPEVYRLPSPIITCKIGKNLFKILNTFKLDKMILCNDDISKNIPLSN